MLSKAVLLIAIAVVLALGAFFSYGTIASRCGLQCERNRMLLRGRMALEQGAPVSSGDAQAPALPASPGNSVIPTAAPVAFQAAPPSSPPPPTTESPSPQISQSAPPPVTPTLILPPASPLATPDTQSSSKAPTVSLPPLPSFLPPLLTTPPPSSPPPILPPAPVSQPPVPHESKPPLPTLPSSPPTSGNPKSLSPAPKPTDPPKASPAPESVSSPVSLPSTVPVSSPPPAELPISAKPPVSPLPIAIPPVSSPAALAVPPPPSTVPVPAPPSTVPVPAPPSIVPAPSTPPTATTPTSPVVSSSPVQPPLPPPVSQPLPAPVSQPLPLPSAPISPTVPASSPASPSVPSPVHGVSEPPTPPTPPSKSLSPSPSPTTPSLPPPPVPVQPILQTPTQAPSPRPLQHAPPPNTVAKPPDPPARSASPAPKSSNRARPPSSPAASSPTSGSQGDRVPLAPGPAVTSLPLPSAPRAAAPRATREPALPPATVSAGTQPPRPSSSLGSANAPEAPSKASLPPKGARIPINLGSAPAPQPATITFPQPKNDDCHKTCTDPYVTTLPGSPCDCVIPMRVGISLQLPLYGLLPLVSELAQELSLGTGLRQSQVQITGASSVGNDFRSTVVRAGLVPLQKRFVNKTAMSIAERLWTHKVAISQTLFGNYTVLYVYYPGLPSSYSQGMTGATIQQPASNILPEQPLGVDIPPGRGKKKFGAGIAVVIALSLVLLILAGIGLVWFQIIRHRSYRGRSPLHERSPTSSEGNGKAAGLLFSSSRSSTSLSFTSFPFIGSIATFTSSEIEKATQNLKPENIVGEGGFGRVYAGILEDQTRVAVKVLIREDHQGDREFAAEVEMLSRLHHRNLVKLIGICTDDLRCLVYELISNGSLESHLHGEGERLSWDARIKIALGAARALAYLHEDCYPRIIHRDFKSSNILLEDDFTPKVSDFGLAKAASEELTGHVSTRVMGTFGYVAPEYAMTGHLLVKSDVYSYGVVLLELLSGRKPIDMSRSPGQENLVTWARPLLTTSDGLELLLDPSLKASVSFENLARVAAIASMCVQPEVSHRPFMGEVVQALKLVCNDFDGSDEAEATAPQSDVTGFNDWDLLAKRLEDGDDLLQRRPSSASAILDYKMAWGMRTFSNRHSAPETAKMKLENATRTGGWASEHGHKRGELR